MKYLQRMRAATVAIGAAVATLLPASTHAQNSTVIMNDDFDQFPVGANSIDGSYGAVAFNFSGAGYGNPFVMITNNNPDTLPGNSSSTHSNNCAFIFDTAPADYPNPLNFGLRITRLPATGNTNASIRAYNLNFDVAVSGGTSISGIGGFNVPSFGVYANDGGEYYHEGAQTNVPTSFFPAVGTGYQHVSVPLSSFGTANGSALNPTNDTLYAFFIAFVLYGHSYPGTVEIDIANLSITMTNPPAIAAPTVHIVPAKPGLRVFAENHAFTYNQEGFATVDPNQSWVGRATPQNPVSYSINIGDFDTVNNYTLYVQFAQNASSGDPFGVYNGQNALVWNITAQSSGFTTAINWKTNSPGAGEPNNVLSLTTGSTKGRGTWTLTFTDDTDGTVTAPDGTSGSFSLPNDPNWTADFANPLTLDFGTAPNDPNGYGQWITYNSISISNVLDGAEFDDFTQDTGLNTSLWNPNFSNDNNPAAYGVVLVPPGNNYWVNWTTPDDGYQLSTKASLAGGTNVWFSPNYYGNALYTNSIPTLMGNTLKWTLVPGGCLPTTDGTQGGPPSKSGFFRLSNPGPAQ